MKYVNSTLRSEQADKLRTSIKRLKLSKNLADYCLENASAKVLNFINDMFAEEVVRREASNLALRMHNAGFPTMKSIDNYNFSELKMPVSMTKEKMLNLDFIESKNNLIMYGVCGSGKTMLSICLGIMACNRKLDVKFITLSQLAVRLRTAAEEGRLENCLINFKKLDLLIIDEWGYCQLDKQSAGYVFQIVSDSYERKSLIITTNLPFSEWGRIVTDEQLAAAIIDRIVHYGHLIDCGKKDWRIATSPMNNQTFVEKKEAPKIN